MNTFEYSDFYKFIVSIGVVLISLSLLFPWLLIREPFDSTLKATDFSELTPEAQSIVAVRQVTAIWLLDNVGKFSLALAFTGIGFLVYGLYNWNKRQKVRDTKKENIEAEKARRELDAMAPEQIAQKAVMDVAEQEETRDIQETVRLTETPEILVPTSSIIKQYFRIEKMVQDKLRSCLGTVGKILINRRIKSAEYDVVLQSKRDDLADAIFEIKYAKKGFHINWVRESVRRLVLATEIYNEALGRNAISVIFFISPRDTLNRIPTESYKFRVQEELGKSGVNPRIVFIAEEDWEPLDCAKLYSIIFDGQSNTL